ncbi:hypothetical protein EVAR_46431_1 [Eumeta japonica]|uniref:Uncharacterized protein n=1 Tax=Eumeta variegata TaxID=151549 RepID=A0A4C1XEQ4_EUMVA|nr:hypothetical protein EVAR_46431_1 [Eumeta japonica]
MLRQRVSYNNRIELDFFSFYFNYRPEGQRTQTESSHITAVERLWDVPGRATRRRPPAVFTSAWRRCKFSVGLSIFHETVVKFKPSTANLEFTTPEQIRIFAVNGALTECKSRDVPFLRHRTSDSIIDNFGEFTLSQDTNYIRPRKQRFRPESKLTLANAKADGQRTVIITEAVYEPLASEL